MRGGKYLSDRKQIISRIGEADAILIGASNGLSIAEGLHLFADNRAFEELFGDLKRKYGISCILQGMGARWPSEEEKWSFWSRLVHRYCGEYRESRVMSDLKKLIGEKDYFIITSNGENHFELAGLDPARILEIEGSWKEMRCNRGCHDTLYPTWTAVVRITEHEKNGHVPTELLPRCPKCGGPMTVNFQPKKVQIQAYQHFVEKYHNKKLLVLELGIGARNQLIKAPLMRLVDQEPDAFYITFNKGELYIPRGIQHKSMGVDGNLGEILPEIAELL